MVGDVLENLIRENDVEEAILVGPRVVLADPRESALPGDAGVVLAKSLPRAIEVPSLLHPVIGHIEAVQFDGPRWFEPRQAILEVAHHEPVPATEIQDPKRRRVSVSGAHVAVQLSANNAE